MYPAWWKGPKAIKQDIHLTEWKEFKWSYQLAESVPYWMERANSHKTRYTSCWIERDQIELPISRMCTLLDGKGQKPPCWMKSVQMELLISRMCTLLMRSVHMTHQPRNTLLDRVFTWHRNKREPEFSN